MIRRHLASAAAIAVLANAAPAHAVSLKLNDSFRIGSGGVLCTAQARPSDPALKSMFDRGYQIVCRDAATPVGKLFALRAAVPDAASLLPDGAAGGACEAPAPATITGLPGAMLRRCTRGGLAYLVFTADAGKTRYAAAGLSGYASALTLGLRSLVSDAPVTGDVEVAVTEAGDAAAFARVQAGSLDPAQALAEGYVRNNAGSFAESSEFFDLLITQNRQGSPGFTRTAEYYANQALQQSNLGNFPEANALFINAGRALDPADPVVSRLVRNFRAMHQLNQHLPEPALKELARTAASLGTELDLGRVQSGFIDVPLAQKLNSDDDRMVSLGGVDNRLTTPERAAILDAQALYLKGAALRMAGRDAEAATALASASTALRNIRDGRFGGVGRMQAEIAVQQSAIHERAGRGAEAITAMDSATALYRVEFPGSAALLAIEAQRAGLLARQGREDDAVTAYRAVIAAAPTTPGGGQSVRLLLDPYFALLSKRSGTAAANDFFDASQILVRPGVAQTQAVLARELSGGSDAAAGLFRQSLTLSRDIIRTEAEINRIVAQATPGPDDAVLLADLRAKRSAQAADQTAVLAQLSDNPKFRSVSNTTVTLKDLQSRLRPGEAYYKLVLVNQSAYALFAAPDMAQVLRVDASADDLGVMVRALRDTIVKFENGRAATYPFDALTARKLYVAMFAPVAAAMPAVRHLVFEPDGALLQLPINLLIEDDASLAAYEKRADADDGDAFDMRGVAWLGRTRAVSTSVSPRAFMEVRALAPSRGSRGYLGLGQNAPPPGDAATPVAFAQGSEQVRLAKTRGAAPVAATPIPSRDPCDWPLSEWRNPISPVELRIGADLVGKGSADVVTGANFSDTALEARKDLRDFRVIHFATHGLVTAPRPECPARPALLTSFGGGASDGLLSFKEVFDLSLDADTIILSACDTAGTATAAATREAGVATGGNYALDGLVRAFVGAGARAVIASHWPVPDNFDATKTLITGLFSRNGQTSVGEALRESQVRLMDALDTSHPYYWSGFAIIGDSAKPLSGSLAQTVASK
ncbi:MAG: CHAT domain-containing protein [Polymorphobacter sp.]